MSFDLTKVREDFPVLQRKVNDKPLVYLDNAATTLKPTKVIEAVHQYYSQESANVHRGVHYLSEVATNKFETTRTLVQNLIHAKGQKEIIFTKGTTDGINLVASAWGRKFLQEGEEIILSHMEHHSNIVPWQILAEEKKLKIKVIPLREDGSLDMAKFETLLSDKTKLISVVAISNSLGTINPIEEIIQKGHQVGAKVLIDGAQLMLHERVDVQLLDCDFLAFSGHKFMGPTGTGILYGKEKILEEMNPYQGGGDMIEKVSFEKTTFNDLPNKFEAGTPHIAGFIGLGAAIEYWMGLNFEEIKQHERNILSYASEQLMTIEGLTPIGTADQKTTVFSFVMNEAHAQDIGTFCDQDGVAIRTGHHCTMPVNDFFQVAATARASFAFYNTKDEVDALIKSLKKIKEVFR